MKFSIAFQRLLVFTVAPSSSSPPAAPFRPRPPALATSPALSPIRPGPPSPTPQSSSSIPTPVSAATSPPTPTGSYTASFLQPGHYEVTIGGGGFGKVDRKNLVLTVGQISSPSTRPFLPPRSPLMSSSPVSRHSSTPTRPRSPRPSASSSSATFPSTVATGATSSSSPPTSSRTAAADS